MKLLYTLLYLGLSSTILLGQGIEFFHGSWEEALEMAQKEDKIIFVDAYAKWCGPCKRMAKDVFTQDAVGEFYNSNFINLKLDMEEKEGLTFGRKYPVGAFPTLFYLDSSGNILLKTVGGKQADALLDLGKKAIMSYDKTDQYAERYEAGERDFELMVNYVRELNKVGKSSLKISNDYLNSDPDLSPDQEAEFLVEAVVEADSKLFDRLVELKDKAIKVSSKERYSEVIAAAALKTVEKAIEFEYAELVNEAVEQFSGADAGDKKQFEYEANLYYHAMAGNFVEWKDLSEKFLKKYGKKNPDAYKEHLSQIIKYFDYESSANDYSYEIMEKLIKAEKIADNYMLFLRKLMNDKNFEKAHDVCKEAEKKFPDSPLYSQFTQMLNFLEKQLAIN